MSHTKSIKQIAFELEEFIARPNEYYVYITPNSDGIDTFIHFTPYKDCDFISSTVLEEVISYAKSKDYEFFIRGSLVGLPAIVLYKK